LLLPDDQARPLSLAELGETWRPAHIHVSIFGTAFSQRQITQMYFEGDPLIPLCPIVKTIPDPEGVKRLIAPLDINAAVPMDCLPARSTSCCAGGGRCCSRTG
jgi:protocatechuate 3,4-dioxygenase beta subunit